MSDIKTGTKITMVLTDMPLGIQVGNKHYFLYPQTLGKIYLTSQIIDRLEINQDNLKVNAFMEALRVVEEHFDDCCLLIAYHTLQKKNEVLNTQTVERRKKEIFYTCDNDDLATILITLLSDNKLNELTKELGLDKESERMAKVNQAKDTKNQFVFGGKSIWGSLIDAACERYGWTYDYVVWGISYNNLNLMLKDKITSIYLSDEERKKAHIPAANEHIFDGNNKEDIMRMVRESEEYPE